MNDWSFDSDKFLSSPWTHIGMNMMGADSIGSGFNGGMQSYNRSQMNDRRNQILEMEKQAVQQQQVDRQREMQRLRAAAQLQAERKMQFASAGSDQERTRLVQQWAAQDGKYGVYGQIMNGMKPTKTESEMAFFRNDPEAYAKFKNHNASSPLNKALDIINGQVNRSPLTTGATTALQKKIPDLEQGMSSLRSLITDIEANPDVVGGLAQTRSNASGVLGQVGDAFGGDSLLGGLAHSAADWVMPGDGKVIPSAINSAAQTAAMQLKDMIVGTGVVSDNDQKRMDATVGVLENTHSSREALASLKFMEEMSGKYLSIAKSSLVNGIDVSTGGAATTPGDIQSRFNTEAASNPALQGATLGKKTPEGYEVYRDGKLLGHYE